MRRMSVLASGTVLALAGGVCAADVDDTIAGCASRASQDARIACLEQALRQLAPPEAAGAPTPPTPAPTPVPSPAPKPAPAAAVPEAVQADGGRAEELGSEQVESRNRSQSEDEPIVSATVVDFDFVGYQRLLVQLDNGQIWRQIDGDRTSVERGLRNETSFDVEMWGTALGGYRMHILPLDRTIRVERLK